MYEQYDINDLAKTFLMLALFYTDEQGYRMGGGRYPFSFLRDSVLQPLALVTLYLMAENTVGDYFGAE